VDTTILLIESVNHMFNINKPKTTPSAESALVQTSGTAIYYGGHNSGINVQVISQGSISDSHYQDSESRFLMLSV
jgi:hypothetical protein